MRIMPPANLPPRSSRAAAAHGRRGQRRRRRICACCFKVITKPDSRAQPESSFLPCRIPTRLASDLLQNNTRHQDSDVHQASSLPAGPMCCSGPTGSCLCVSILLGRCWQA